MRARGVPGSPEQAGVTASSAGDAKLSPSSPCFLISQTRLWELIFLSAARQSKQRFPSSLESCLSPTTAWIKTCIKRPPKGLGKSGPAGKKGRERRAVWRGRSADNYPGQENKRTKPPALLPLRVPSPRGSSPGSLGAHCPRVQRRAPGGTRVCVCVNCEHPGP